MAKLLKLNDSQFIESLFFRVINNNQDTDKTVSIPLHKNNTMGGQKVHFVVFESSIYNGNTPSFVYIVVTHGTNAKLIPLQSNGTGYGYIKSVALDNESLNVVLTGYTESYYFEII